MKDGFKTSEFLVYIFAAIMCGIGTYFKHPLDFSAVIGLLTVVYMMGRFILKHQDAKNAFESAKQADPNFKVDLEDIVASLAPLLIDALKKKNIVVGAIAQEAVNSGVRDLEK